MEAYRDNIPKQSKLADSISFYGTIELFCSFKKLILFLSNTRNYFLFHDLCLKYTEVNYTSASFTAQSFRRLICSGEEHVYSVIKRGSFHQYWRKIVWDHYNSFFFTLVTNGNFDALFWNNELLLILFPRISQPFMVFLFTQAPTTFLPLRKTALCLTSPSGKSLSMVKENNT